jgi:hypothetical protein
MNLWRCSTHKWKKLLDKPEVADELLKMKKIDMAVLEKFGS